MGKSLSYFDLAENDYNFLLEDIKLKRVGNILCTSSQSICERYLKHIIDVYCIDIDTTTIMRTHSLKALRNFMKSEIRDFTCNWNIILQADGYYFSARYPGDDSFIVDEEDVINCWEAVEETRKAVKDYCDNHKQINTMNLF